MAQGYGNGGSPRTPLVVVPFLPPTSNNIYGTSRNGKRYLTQEADVFKKKMISLVVQATGHLNLEAIPKRDDRAMFEVFYVFYCDDEDLLNMTYGTGTKKAAATRYKRMDTENRIKLVADAFSTGIGIDDSLFFCGGHAKCSAKLVGNRRQIHIFFDQADPSRFGL